MKRAKRQTGRRSLLALLVSIACLGASRAASAADPRADDELTFRADETTLDASKPGEESISLAGRVVLTYGRFRLTSDALSIVRAPSALPIVHINGSAKLAPCLCERPPVSMGFSSARISKTGEIEATLPRFYLGPLPVFALPWIWIRPVDRIGLFPPQIGLRGSNGLFLGSGLRLPWRREDGGLSAIELRAGAYLLSGFEVDARMSTQTTSTTLVWDRLKSDRVMLQARGVVLPDPSAEPSIAWSIDALRGSRALVATPSLASASRPFDTAAIETAATLSSSAQARSSAGLALLARAPRGLGPIVWGPRVTLFGQATVGKQSSIEASALFSALADARGTTPIGRTEAAYRVHHALGPLRFSGSLRARGRAALAAEERSLAWDAAGDLDLEARLPMQRAFLSPQHALPWIHTLAPLVEARAFASRVEGQFFQPQQSLSPALGFVALGLASTLSQASLGSLDADARVAIAGTSEGAALVTQARLSGAAELFSAFVELDAAMPLSRTSLAGADGVGLLVDARVGSVGREESASLHATAAYRGGDGAALARSLGPFALVATDGLALLRTSGLTLGADANLPATSALLFRAGASLDATARELLGVRGALRYRHPQGCAAFELGGSARLGRPGLDVWLMVDLIPPVSGAP